MILFSLSVSGVITVLMISIFIIPLFSGKLHLFNVMSTIYELFVMEFTKLVNNLTGFKAVEYILSLFRDGPYSW